jgi:hypothetical protein
MLRQDAIRLRARRSTGLRSLDKNEAQLESVIPLIRRQPPPTVFSLIFRHKPELAAHPQIQICRDAAQLISALIARGIEPIDSDSGMGEVVYYRRRGLSVSAEAGESATGSDIVPTTLDTAEKRQPFRNWLARIECDAVEIISEHFVRLKRSIRAYYRYAHITVVIIQSDGPAIEMENSIDE